MPVKSYGFSNFKFVQFLITKWQEIQNSIERDYIF